MKASTDTPTAYVSTIVTADGRVLESIDSPTIRPPFERQPSLLVAQ
ncbi:hypothetical protein [Halohasta litorea]|uniref:Uncharacterized protein n=1 Tax=Halohasta litorea TaxID=869891 RepID=A0ABD6D371_9EURY|nr:hypothetical protein [Halohasta litorea]